MKEHLVVTLVEHPLWGFILQPTLVEKLESGSLSILEIVDSHSSCFSSLDSPLQNLVLLAEKFSEKILMKIYSKDKTVADFHRHVKQETIDSLIRPRIERQHAAMIRLISEFKIEVYFREAIKKRVLYLIDQIDVGTSFAQILFKFIRQDDKSIRYSIKVEQDSHQINFFNKDFGIICTEPAIVCVNNFILVFETIDVKKLLPFFEKEAVIVSPSHANLYIQKFISVCVRDFSVATEGIGITQIFPKRRASLSLENGLDGLPNIILKFDYEGQTFGIDSPEKKVVISTTANGETSLQWFDREQKWESKAIQLLTGNGLKIKNGSQFTLPSDDLNFDATHSYIFWLQAHQELLSNFDFTQNLNEKIFYVGNVQLKELVDTRQDWFDVKSIVIAGNYQIPFVKFRNHLLNGIHEYILPDNSILVLPDEWFSRYQDIMIFGKKTQDGISLHRSQYRLIDDLKIGNPIDPITINDQDVEVPIEIQAQLRPYQQKGFSWLVHLFQNNFGGCLGDDMGLGKTLQTICLLQFIHNEKINCQHNSTQAIFQSLPLFTSLSNENNHGNTSTSSTSLVVVPTSLIHNWLNEIQKFAPSLKVHAYTGVKRMKTKDIDKFFRLFDVIITTYGTLRVDINYLKLATFHHLILDESQFVRNPESLTYKAVKQINAKHKLILTGTLIENSLADLWAQFEIINEGMLGSFSGFKKMYINPVTLGNKDKEEKLLKMIHPFILRRTKQEVAPELPPLTEEVIYCSMSEEQDKAYESEKSRIRNSLTVENTSINNASTFAFLTLQGLTRLRLLANHPILFDGKFDGTSGKFEQVMMNLEELIERHHKVLVFSSFVKHLRLFTNYFKEKGWKFSWLSGETQVADRERQIANFQEREDVNCFFISLKAGGVGLNLTAADYVFIIDPWWNPAAEMQALSRSHRIGQDKNVMVYRFITQSTIEDKIRQLQNAKSRLAEIFVTSNNPLSGMEKEDIEELLS